MSQHSTEILSTLAEIQQQQRSKRRRHQPEDMSHGTGTYLNAGSRTKKPYVRVCYGPQRDQYVHKLVMEGMLGRALQPGEEVEHFDGDGTNNRWDNLVLVQKAEHGHMTRDRCNAARENPLDGTGLTE